MMSRGVSVGAVLLTVAGLMGVGCVMDSGSGDDDSTSESLRAGCQPGAPCQPTNQCKLGTISCSGRARVCVEGANKPAGTLCGTGAVCNAVGVCAACAAGAACSPANPCKVGATSCTTGAAVCVETTNRAAGTACGVNAVCTASGVCAACTAGVACSPASPCKVGAISCATGAAVCVETGNRPVGTACGAGKVCNGAGTCG